MATLNSGKVFENYKIFDLIKVEDVRQQQQQQAGSRVQSRPHW